MTTRLFLIRHGATELSAEDRFAGETDVALSEEGRRQIQALGVRLSEEPIAAVYASTKQRAIDTARAVAQHHQLEVITDDDLREISHGRWEGLNREEAETRYPDEYARYRIDPYSYAPEGGESGVQLTARALPALLRIVKAHQGATVAVVSHKATIRLLLSSLLGFDARSYRDRLDQSLAALNVLDFNDQGNARLMLFNDVSHYAAGRACLPAAPNHRLSKEWDQKGPG